MAASAKDRQEFIAIMIREFPDRQMHEVLSLCRKLMRYSATSNRLAETICSVDLGEAGNARVAAQDEANDARVEGICQAWGIEPVFSGDPRGCTVKLKVPSGKTNDWGQEGICVPQ